MLIYGSVKLVKYFYFPGNKKGGRDIETEEMLEDLHSKISQLENHNQQLKEKARTFTVSLVTRGRCRVQSNVTVIICQLQQFKLKLQYDMPVPLLHGCLDTSTPTDNDFIGDATSLYTCEVGEKFIHDVCFWS